MKWFTGMGTIINMVSVSKPFSRFFSGGSIELSAKAAKKCVRDAGIDPCDIGLLINTGIYRYKNFAEPAIAAMIQKRIGANSIKNQKEYNNINQRKSTFSFDLNNGGCGWLTGIQIADGFLQRGEIKYGMVITGDSDPFNGLSENFKFESAAAAIILSGIDGPVGFSSFRSYSYPEHNKEFISKTYYGFLKGKRGKRNILSVRQQETYLNLCIDLTLESLNNFLDETGLRLNEIDLIITSQSPEGFISGLNRNIAFNGSFIEINRSGNKEFHTAGPAFALKKAWDDNHFRTSGNILFLTVGSGISVSFALYKN
jgi:3-oxoacyl-[acyl-carrier-protein] synthase III